MSGHLKSYLYSLMISSLIVIFLNPKIDFTSYNDFWLIAFLSTTIFFRFNCDSKYHIYSDAIIFSIWYDNFIFDIVIYNSAYFA